MLRTIVGRTPFENVAPVLFWIVLRNLDSFVTGCEQTIHQIRRECPAKTVFTLGGGGQIGMKGWTEGSFATCLQVRI